MTEDERAIRALVEQWMDASRTGDLPAVLELMSDDVLFLTPGRDPFGKQEFLATSQSLKDVAIDGRASIQEIQVAGDWAWLRNHIDLTITPRESAPINRSGDTLTILRKGENGQWRLYRDANFVS